MTMNIPVVPSSDIVYSKLELIPPLKVVRGMFESILVYLDSVRRDSQVSFMPHSQGNSVAFLG